MSNPGLCGFEAAPDEELDRLMEWHQAHPETLEEKAARIAVAYTRDHPGLRNRVYAACLATLKGEPAIPVVIDYKTRQVVDVAAPAADLAQLPVSPR